MNIKHLLKIAIEVMPLEKWKYCHEILKKEKNIYCDWVFEQFLYELIYLNKINLHYENILKLNLIDKNEKQKLIKIIKSNRL